MTTKRTFVDEGTMAVVALVIPPGHYKRTKNSEDNTYVCSSSQHHSHDRLMCAGAVLFRCGGRCGGDRGQQHCRRVHRRLVHCKERPDLHDQNDIHNGGQNVVHHDPSEIGETSRGAAGFVNPYFRVEATPKRLISMRDTERKSVA